MIPAQQDAELYDMASVMNNQKSIAFVRTIMSISGGFAAGVLGLTGATGFLFFVLLYVATSAMLLLRMGFQIDKFIPKGSSLFFLFGEIPAEALSFVLYWTLMYALVHIY